MNLGAHDVGAPLTEHRGNNEVSAAGEDVAQLLPIQPGADGAFGSVLSNEMMKIIDLFAG